VSPTVVFAGAGSWLPELMAARESGGCVGEFVGAVNLRQTLAGCQWLQRKKRIETGVGALDVNDDRVGVAML
jgi:hypothetical protein